MSAEMTLTVSDYERLAAPDRTALNEWICSALGKMRIEDCDVFEVRLGEGWCEFGRYVQAETVSQIHQRVRCPLPPVWPMRRP